MRSNNRIVAVEVAVAALIVVGCAVSPPRFTWTGLGAATSQESDLPAGTYEITWAADDAPGPPAGCRFDLVLDGDHEIPDAEQPLGRVILKLAHETTGAGGTIRGGTSLVLDAQRYRFHVEGSCAWRVTVVDG